MPENLHVAGKIWVRYGSYLHDPGEVEYSISAETLLTDSQTPYAEKVRVVLQGRLTGATTTEIESKAASLIAAYSRQSQDLTINLGPSKASVLSLYSSDCNGGVRVVGRPSFPSNRAAAHVTFLDYVVVLEGERRLSAPTAFRSFAESVTRNGGGPVYVMLQPRRGKAQRQLGTQQQYYSAVQQGSAVGLYAKPSPPSPIWPFALKESGEFGETGGRPVGSSGLVMDLSITWKYVFESTTPLFGSPRSWGNG